MTPSDPTRDIAAMLHYRGRVLHPRSHVKTTGGPCDECIESARQAMEFVRPDAVEDMTDMDSPTPAEDAWGDRPSKEGAA